MRVLLTNDDGIGATGLQELRRALEAIDEVEVHVIAPDSNRSATARSITTRSPLWVHEVEFGDGRSGFSSDGTPVDCVRFADLGLLGDRPELIVSGINHGSNLGDDVTYSGTVSAAMESTLLGIPSIAVSLVGPEQGGFEEAGKIARLIAMRTLVEGLPAKTLLNVNVPAGRPKGIRFARLGHRVYKEKVVEEKDPRGKTYYWIGAGPPLWDNREATDIIAVQDGYAAVTPLHLDLTHYEALRRLGDWEAALNAQLRPRRKR
jgi:5'-nucleotidase